MLDALLLLVSTTALLLGSPGPAPLALAASSAAFGVRSSLPFLAGILGGLAVVIVGAVVGIAALLSTWPVLKWGLQGAGAAYIVYVAFKIATAPIINLDKAQQPSLRDGFMLNLLNPKAYAAFLALFSGFLLPAGSAWASFLLTGLVCFLVALVVDVCWVLAGGMLKAVFVHPFWARAIRQGFALAMVFAVGLTLLAS